MDAEENIDEDYNKSKEMKALEKRFCKKCCIPKPLRAHHCS
jgi:palmitoyltransferase